MCRFKSALVLKNRIFVPDYDSHDKMLQELGIKDNFTNASKVFVRVELFPADGNVFSAVDDWEMKVDQDILPERLQMAYGLPPAAPRSRPTTAPRSLFRESLRRTERSN